MRILVFFCSVWCVLGSATVAAQDQTPETIPATELEVAADEPVSEEPTTNSDTDDVAESGEAEASGRFIPTEEISQDLGVSFPANI